MSLPNATTSMSNGAQNAAEIARAMAEAAARRMAEEAARRAAQEAAQQAAQQAAKAAAQAALQKDSFSNGQGRPQVNLNGGVPSSSGSSLVTENTLDGQSNCLDLVGDKLASDPALAASCEVVFLTDNRQGAEGETGHVVIRQGNQIWDPASGQWTPTAQYLRAHPEYDVAGTASGQGVHDILSAPPGPEREAALAKSGIDPALASMMVADEGDETPWMVSVTAFENHPGYMRASNSSASDVVQELPVGTEVEVLETQGDWYHVRTADGQEGWIVASRTEYVSGTATGEPFVLPDGRDGSAASGAAHAESLIGGTGYVDQKAGITYCLGFVNDSFYISGVPARCPEMYNPGAYGYAATAFGAYSALNDNDKILTSNPTDALPEGSIVFFDQSDANGMAGHVAIATGELAPDGSPMLITSGFLNSPETKYMSLLELQEDSGTYLGYTTPELAFTSGTYGGGSAVEQSAP